MKIVKYIFLFLIIANLNANAQYWQKVELPPQTTLNAIWLDIFFIDSLYGWVCGQNTNQVLRTNDGGNTWQITTIPVPFGVSSFFEHIHFIDTMNGLCSGPAGLYKTTNGGNTWKPITCINNLVNRDDYDTSKVEMWGSWLHSKDTMYALGGGCFRSVRIRNENIPSGFYDSVYVKRLVWRSTNGGNTWTFFDLGDIPIPNYGTSYFSGLTHIMMYKTGIGYIASSGIIYKTTDFGDSWSLLSLTNRSSTGGNLFAWQEQITNIENTNIILVPYSGTTCTGGGIDLGSDDRGGVIWSNDGVNWRKYSTNAQMYGTALISPTEGWGSGFNATVVRTQNAGTTWELFNTGIDTNDNLDDIFFLNERFGWVVGRNIYRLVFDETEIYVEKHNFDTTICKPAIIIDTTTIITATNNDVRYSIEVFINNDLFNFDVAPKPFISNIYPGGEVKVIVTFIPNNNAYGTQKYAIIINTQPENENKTFIDTIYYTINIKDSITTSSDTIDFGTIMLANNYQDSITLYANANDTLKLVNIEGNEASFCTISHLNKVINHLDNIYITHENNNTITFNINPQDTGNYLIKYTFQTPEPCNQIKEIYVKFNVIHLQAIMKINDSIYAEVICKNDTIIAIPIENKGNDSLIISNLIADESIDILGFGTQLKSIPITIAPDSTDTLFISLTSDIDTIFHSHISIFHNDSSIISPAQITITTAFRKVIIEAKEIIIDFGTICVGDSVIRTFNFINTGNLPVNFSINAIESPFYLVDIGVISEKSAVKPICHAEINNHPVSFLTKTTTPPQEGNSNTIKFPSFGGVAFALANVGVVKPICLAEFISASPDKNIGMPKQVRNDKKISNEIREKPLKTLLISNENGEKPPKTLLISNENGEKPPKTLLISNENGEKPPKTLLISNEIREISNVFNTKKNDSFTFSDSLIANFMDTVCITASFKAITAGSFVDTLRIIDNTCGGEVIFILRGNSVANIVDYAPKMINERVKIKEENMQYIAFSIDFPDSLTLDSAIFINKSKELWHGAELPMTIGGSGVGMIAIHYYSDVVTAINDTFCLHYTGICSGSFCIPISIDFYEDTCNIIIRWDSVINKEPNEIVSLHAIIESIDIPLSFEKIDINIGMDYKLLMPINLFVISEDIEYPLAYNFAFANGISASIAPQELKSGAKLLRLEGMTLMSLPTSTPVYFDTFDIISEQTYLLTLLSGLLDVSNFCGSDWRGGMIFLPNFDANLEQNPVYNDILEVNFSASGDIVIDIEITDIEGNKLITDKIKLPQGDTIKEINLGAISSGKYFINFSTFYHTIAKQIVIAR
ncbi:MAG: YCF48-related protein [Bacteroidetes bacterium]|nr:YCF48-related protein [Bacteroidota bacterium]